jgi:DNA-binding response OmpR family regulator
MINICPHCGVRSSQPAAVQLDGWRLTPELAVFRSKGLHLTGAEAALLFALGMADGNILTTTILGRQFSELEDNSGSVRVIISRLRKKLGPSCPIETIRGLGYRWQQQEMATA